MFKTHGMWGTRPYQIWHSMVGRCHRPNHRGSYKNYGGRGIKVCAKWRTFAGFWEDMEEGYGEKLTIDRLDNDGDYCLENCKWSTWDEQAKNKKPPPRNTSTVCVVCGEDGVIIKPVRNTVQRYCKNCAKLWMRKKRAVSVG